ncbi:InlB B-repeat-containing protein [Collinsella sp. An307]|uniref:InlB B-repeat-containing protein n=1 Tax=Collinsella sp. An307 TaxID=1965630 RepID=UPI000B3925C8|nr:InlB B-repeat-containing protein [Collinsella sp. An307]
MHVPQKLRKELKRKGTKALAFFLAFVLAVQCMNLPVIVAAATDAAGNALATVEDTPSNDQATSAATDQAADQAATETEQPATEQAPVEQPATEQAPVEQPAEPAEPAEPATEEPAATEAPAADQPAESTTPAGSENVTEGGASENGQAPVAPAADTTATVALSLAESTLTVGADTYTATDATMEAPTNQELKFTVAPEGGFAVKTVKQIAADRTETELSADASGIYTIAPEAVADGLEIKVETEEAQAAEEQPAEEAPAEEPATDESTDETTEPTEDEAATEEPAEDEAATDEQTPADEATEDEAVEEAASEDKAAVVDELVTEDGQAVTELESDSVKADVSSPAFEGYAHVGDITVKVTAGEGIVPEGTTVSAYRVNRQDVLDAVSSVVEKNGKVVEDSVAIDVTLLGPDGNVIQPDGAVNVCFFNTSLGGGEISVWRVADDASTVQAIGTRQADASVQSFDVDHFSIYVVTDEGEPALATYNFYVNDRIVSTQVVKTGDTLYEPAAPEANDNGFKFTGWYTKEQGGELFDGFGEQNVSETMTVDLYAHFEEVHYVFFYDNQGRIFHTEEGMTGYSVSVGEATQILEQSLPINQGLAGWYTSEGFEGDSVESVTLENANIYLYPKVVNGHWITFSTEGGTYIEPQFVAGGATSVGPENPTRPGYTFVGWETEDGKNFNFGDELTDDVKLVAQWNPGQTSYRVIYWVEKANWKEGDNEADRYSFMSSEVIDNVSSGSTTNVGGIDWWDWDYNDLSFNDAELQTVEQKTVAGDGSTIVNVYYNRAEYKVVFKTHREGEYKLTCTKTEHTHEYEGRDWHDDGWFSGHYEYTGGCYGPGWHREGQTNCGIDEHQHEWWEGCYEYVGGGWSDAYVIEAKVGAYIGDQWPTSEDVDGGPYRWAISESARTWQAHMEVMPSGGDEFWGQTASGTSTATYWVENVEGTGYEVHHRDVSAGTGMGVSPEDKYELQGFTYDRGPVDGSDYSGADFYYTRNDYTVSFINGDEQQDRTKPYQASLDDLAYTPNKPSTVEENFVFAGWYDNQFGEGDPFNFDTTMPAYNLSLYAVWKAPEVSVSYYSDMDGAGTLQTIDAVSYGETINENQLGEPAEVEDMQFVGWATRTGTEGNYVYTLFNFDTEIRSDVVLYPYYISKGSFKVTYDSNGASETAPTDDRKYAEDAYADVLSAEGMTAPEGEVFLGWSTNKDGTGTLYQPEDKILIEGNVTLYAHWGHRPSQVTVTYDANYPEGAVPSGAKEEYTTDSFPSNAEHTVFEFEAINGFEVPDGYKFVGWTNGSATYKPGDKVRVDELQKGGDNTLTAQWTHVGTQIYVKVVLDGNQVAAKKYVNPVVDGTTQGFMATYDPNTQLYTIDYTYENFNCADFILETFDIPAGYVVSVSSDNTNDTLGIDGSIAEYHDPVEENGNWTLDNVPGGATVTVDLHKSEYAVKYVADDNGSVSTKQEVVKYGENANGSTAKPDDGYFFVNWTDSEGEVVSTDPTYVPQNVTANATYTAHFAKKYEVTIRANSKSDTYDGTMKSVSGFQDETDKGVPVVADDVTYYVNGLTSEASGVNVADSVNSIPVIGTAVVKDANGNDVSARFDVSVTPGFLTIAAREITVHAEKTVKYNGSDQKLDITEGHITTGSVADGESLDLSASITGRNKGVYEEFDADPTYKVTDGEGNETTANYRITVTGKLTIEQAAADAFTGTVTLDDWTYGDEAKAEVPEVTPEGSDYDGPTYQYKVRGADDSTYTDQKPTQAGDYTVKAVWAATENCPEISDTDDFSILRRPVTITVADDSKIFGQDDPVFEDAVMTNHVKGELADIDLSVIRSNEEEGVDHYEDVLTIGQTAEELNGLYGNYTFTVEPGDFEITQQTINPEDPDNPDSYLNVQVSQPADVTYNGQHQQSPVKVERLDADGKVIATLEEGVDYKLTYVDDVNAGTAKVKVEGQGNYKGQITKEYTINPAKAMIVVSNNAKVYGEDDPDFQGKVVLYNDGACDQPLYLNVLTRKQDVLGDIAYSRTNAEVESAGTYEGVLTAAVKDGTLNGNYTYDVWPGDFHIAKSTDLVAKITSTAEDMTKVYDGKALTLTAEATPAEGSTLMYSTDGGTTWTDEAPSITNVGTLDVQVKAVNPNYEDSYPVEATLTVTPATLTITTPSAAKVFDGTPLEAPGSAEECVTGLKNGETVDFKTTGAITAVGQTDNTYAIVFAGEEGATEATAQSGNYRIVTEDLGTLQVFPQSVDPDDPDPSNPDPDDPDPSKPDPENPDQPFYTGITVEWPGNTEYNGKSQELPVTVKDRNGNVLTQSTDGGKTGDYVLVYGDDTVNAGEVKVTVKGVNNYGGEISGSYQITPVTLTISTPDASKLYDGTALTTGEDSATVEGLMDDDQVQTTVYGSQTEADVSANHVRIDGWVNTEPTNYDVKLNLGTLLVYPQSINPGDPDPSNPDPNDPDPTVPDPENPKQPFYSGATVNSPSDLTYDGADHTWEPTVRDAQGNVLVLNRDYAVTYSKADRTNVTGAIEVTITGMGDYAGTVERTYQITPREIVLTIDNQTKVAGTADPTFTSSYEGTVPGEVAGWSFQTGHVRDAGEAVGSYAINQGDMQLADNPSTGFLASNYTLRVVPGTLTITPAPATPGDGGTGTNPGTNPGGGTGTNPGAGTTATPTPAAATDGTAAAATDDTAEAIEDEATPLAAGTERISDDETPLASGREDRDCWVHWLMLVGLVISAVYYLGAVIHRRKFTADLEGYEKDVLDPDNRNA